VCNLSHPVPDPSAQSPADYGDDPSGNQQGAPGAAAPTKMAPTKLSKLLKVIMPVVQGGLVGGFGGNPRQFGSGMATAQNYYNQQTELRQRQQQLQQEASDKYYLDLYRQSEAARANEQANRPQFTPGTAEKVQKDGKTYWAQRNPQTGALEATDMEAPPEPTRVTVRPTDQGDVAVETQGPEPGKVTQLRTQGHTPLATGAPPYEQPPGGQPEEGVPGSTQPQKVGARSISKEQFDAPGLNDFEEGVPLMPPKKAATRPIIRTERDAQGVERDYEYDNTGKKISEKPIATRQPRPRAPAKAPAKPDKGNIEQIAQAALEEAKGDPDKAIAIINAAGIAPEKKAAARASVREIKKPGATGKKSVFDRLGIDPSKAAQAFPTAPR
jgi:hypothetical protein